MLLDNEASKNTKWHVFEEGITDDEDKYICDNCLELLKDIRRKCHLKVDNPHHNIFESFIPWFAKEVPGLAESFTKK